MRAVLNICRIVIGNIYAELQNSEFNNTQDIEGGLEAKINDVWQPLPPLPGLIIINVGDSECFRNLNDCGY